MLQFRFPKLLALGVLTLGLFSATFASDITPLRTGPVSQYGQLQAGKNASGKGRIYGNCAAYSTSGNEVVVKGMSLFWSCAANQQRYWKKDVITGLVQRQNIQLIRAAMAVDDMGDWADGHYFTKPDFYQAMLDEAVEAAIENDIYVIIDFHSHMAADSVENAKAFFRIQAEKWGKYDNVIFEVFNEPICASGSVGDNSDCSNYGGFIGMDDIKTYADQVISVIREYSDNLIIVGTPQWDQHPEAAINYPVNDPKSNVAYALHYYAGETYHHDFNDLTYNAESAMNKGVSVFVSEWGTVDWDGGGSVGETWNPRWQTWMNENKISQANWNAGINTSEGGLYSSEYFGADFNPTNNWTYSASGQWVNANVFAGLTEEEYSACTEYVDEDFFIQSSSSSSEESREYVVTDFDGNGNALYNYAYAYGASGLGNTWDAACNDGEGCYVLVMETAAQNGTYGGGLQGITGDPQSPSAGGAAVFNVAVPGLSGCKVLQYSYKGAEHTLKVRLNESDDYTYIKTGFAPKTDWTMATVSVADMEDMYGYGTLGENAGSVSDIRFEVVGQPSPDYLYIDDVECVLGGPSSSSGGDEPASSSSIKLPVVAAPTTHTELFDDFEDGDYMPLWEGVGNFWAETDVVGGGGSSNAELSFVKGSASAKALQMSYSLDVGDYPWGPPYVTISTNDFNEMNLSQCSEVRYDYKGAAHKFRLKVNSTMNDLLDMGWGFPTFAVTSPSDSWQTVTIPVASLAQEWTGSSGNWVDVETVLQYANGFDWRVDGEDADDKSSGTLAIDNIRCVGLAETQYYRITFMNGTEPYEAKDWAAGSNVPDPEGTPAKAPDAQFTYTFSNWTYGSDGYGNPTRYVTGTATYEAVYNPVLRAYTVTFLMDDGTPVENRVLEDVEYGTLVSSIVPADPTKESTAEYTYAFTGWSPDIADATVTGDIDYTAVFSENKNKYAVTFMDDDESILKAAVEYDYGTLPGAIDVPTVEGKNGKKFAGWEPGLATVTKEVTYKAVYTDKIVITWKDDDGSVLRQDYVDDGDMPNYGEAPAKESTAEFTYTFDKWTPTVVAATENATYTASYTSVKNKYDVTFVAEHNPDANITVSKEYGEAVASFAPQVDGAVTAEYTYVFDGWMPVITDQTVITGGVTYTAKYKQNKNQYTVAFVSDDGSTLLSSVTRDYGTEIVSMFPSPDPTKEPTDARTYEFDRWVIKVSDIEDTELAEGAVLVSDMKLKAVFKEFPRKYGITFLNEDNSVFKAQVLYEYGTLASVILPEENPTKDSDDKFSYTFANWDPQVTDVTGEAVYRPVFTSTALAPESSSSSAEEPESSSSEEPESSSAEVAESSSGETPVVSSSSETVVASSSSEKPVSSSSTEIAANSSSSTSAPLSSSRNDDEKSSSSSADKTDGLYPAVGSVNMIFAHNELTVTVPKASEVKVLVFDMQGHLQEHYLGYSAGDHVVSLGHLNRGVYIVRVAGGNVVKTQRIMIK